MKKIWDFVKENKWWIAMILFIVGLGILYKETGKNLFTWIFGEDNLYVQWTTLIIFIGFFVLTIVAIIIAVINQVKEFFGK